MPALFPAARTVLAVDPGLNATGFSLWMLFGPAHEPQHQLIAAGLVQMPASWRLQTVTERSAEITRQLVLAGSIDAVAPSGTVIELPQAYVATKTKGDPNDLINLAALAGCAAGELHRLGSRIHFVRPAEWKGNTPKDCTEARAKVRLQPSELARILLPKAESLQHNVWDAVGIGLWATGRK